MNGTTNAPEAARDDDKPSAVCFIVEDDPAVGRFIARALRDFGVESLQFATVDALVAGIGPRRPDLIFLDISLGDTDAVDAIRALAARGVTGPIQLMSGSNSALLEDVRLVGVRHGLRMRPALAKPFRVDAIRRVVEEERLSAGETAAARHRDAMPAAERRREAPMRIDLGEALEKGWLELWYQPKLDLRRRTLAGAEGLARVRHPEHGVVFPGSFIPDADEDALVALAEHALRIAVRDTADFDTVGGGFRLAINVPVEALLKLPIPAIVRDSRGGNGNGWNGIILEVTEDQVIRDIATAHEIATQLRIYRIALAIDDFGRGYSSLARLKELPFAELKLDQSFVRDSGRDPTNAALCQTVVDLAHRFGSVAVAEGIETMDDLAAVERTGCDIGQGFLFAHAMPKPFLLALLKANGADGGFGSMIAAGSPGRDGSDADGRST